MIRRGKLRGTEKEVHLRLLPAYKRLLQSLCAYYGEPYSIIVSYLIYDKINKTPELEHLKKTVKGGILPLERVDESNPNP